MSSPAVIAPPAERRASWLEANQRCLDLELQRLRLLLHRHVLWLRTQWKQDPLQAYQGVVISDEQADGLLSVEDQRGEARFYAQDAAAAAITQSLDSVDRQLTVLRGPLVDASELPAVDKLTLIFDLTPFERDTMLLCLAPELDPAFERLYGYVQDDVTRKYATPHLALTLFAGPTGATTAGDVRHSLWDARNSFTPDARLRRHRLIMMDASGLPGSTTLMSPLRADARVVDYLRGRNRLDERITHVVRLPQRNPVVPVHRDLVERLVQSGDLCWGRNPTPLNLIGPRRSWSRSLASALCQRAGLQLHVLEPSWGSGPPGERDAVLALVDRDMRLLDSALFLDTSGLEHEEPALRHDLRQFIERSTALLIVASEEPWASDRHLTVVSVPPATSADRRAIWFDALSGVPHTLDGDIDMLLEQFELDPDAIGHAVALARGQVRIAGGGGAAVTDLLWQASRAIARTRLDDLAQRVTSSCTWDDLVVPDDVRTQLQEIANQVAYRFQVLETWGFGARLSRGRGITALFAGPSGTGKTMAAEILANHLSLDLYRIDLAGVVNKYIGETEKNLRRVFDAAEQSGAILFFDEADALFGKRSEVKDSHDRYANIEVDYLLQRMEDYRGLAILATNRKTALDRAFLRRLRFLVDYPSPDAMQRRRIWEKAFPAAAPLDRLDFDAIARLEISGGNIRNIALNAAFLAASDKRPIGTAHVMRAARREYEKIDRLPSAAEFGAYCNMVAS